jgi:aminoglycoside phosphotransferase (APT) family kinase protein
MGALARRLAVYLERRLGVSGLAVEELRPLGGGWENENHRFSLGGSVPEALTGAWLLRRYPLTRLLQAQREALALSRLQRLGYPVPELLLLEEDRGPLGTPFAILRFVEGVPLWPLLRSGGSRAVAELQELSATLAELHRLPAEPFLEPPAEAERLGLIPRPGRDEQLELLGDWIARHRLAGLRPALDWVERRWEASAGAVVPRHGDFHPGNVIVRPGGEWVVVDWTGFSLGDPRMDLAWTVTGVLAIAGDRPAELVLAAYEREQGSEVRGFEPFLVLACLRRLAGILVALRGYSRDVGLRPEALPGLLERPERIRALYELLLGLCGVRLPEIDWLLAALRQRRGLTAPGITPSRADGAPPPASGSP